MSEQNTGGQPNDADYWYALGVKDGRDGCLVELDALQARCDKLEAAAREAVKQLEDARKQLEAPGPGCIEGACDSAVEDIETIQSALRSAVGGGG